ncbi:MAG: heme exporter protein CcmB [Gammaproteobacteria bacterium]|nr:heme exporter protein CcmB [Gammaproteobacteria bacterium]
MISANGAMPGQFRAILLRDLRVYFRTRAAWLNPLVFILLAITLFTLGLGPDRQQLAANAAAIVWVVALLGIMLSLDALFRSDYDDGSLEQMLLSPQPLYFAIIAKVLAHWLVTGMPVIVATPLFALMLGLDMAVVPLMALGLLLGCGILSFLGAIGAALTVSLHTGGLLIALIILPFYVPVIIFGAGLMQFAVEGWATSAPLLMLAGLLCAASVLAPLAIAAGLRISVDN